MSRPLIVLPEAEEEMLAAMGWYENRRAGLGIEFVGVVEHALVQISQAPGRFEAWPSDPRYRRAVLDRFPYVVVFQDRPEAVEVVAVAHSKRRAGYWTGRSRP